MTWYDFVPGLLLGHIADYFTGWNVTRLKCVFAYVFRLQEDLWFPFSWLCFDYQLSVLSFNSSS